MNAPKLNYPDRLSIATGSRHEAIKSIFQSDIISLTSLMGPMSDGPEWPAGAAWLACQHNGNACIVSDGLSDPWIEQDRPQTGLGIEVFIESPDVKLADNDLSLITDYWMFPMMAEISHTLVSYPKLCNTLLTGQPLSMEFNIDHIKDGRGRVGCLLHQAQSLNSSWSNVFGDVQLIAATLLTQQELSFLRGKGMQGKQQLAETLYQAGNQHISYLQRESVV